MPFQNDTLLRALMRQPVDYTPIWIMRQAGRYLPEYREVRKQAGSFMTLCKTPALACEVTLQPLRRFPLDAAILFSDILTIPDAMGLGLYFVEGEGPKFSKPVRTEKEIHALNIPDPEKSLTYVLDAVRLIKKELAGSVPLIGFCGSPWTLACYMTEGSSHKAFPQITLLRKEQPAVLHHLLDVLAQSVAAHLNAQINAGVDVVMLFDTWGGMLDKENYEKFSLYYCKKIIANVTREKNGKRVPFILFTKNGGEWLNLMAQSGCDALGVDWLVDLSKARKEVNNQVALQGNMNPQFLYKTPDEIREEVKRILTSYGAGPGHVFNLGHGILPDVPPENVAVLVDAVHTFSRA